MMAAKQQVPAEVLAELANEFAAGLPARAAVMREAVDEIELRPSPEAAQRLRLTAHALAGTASAFGASELTPHAERLESLGRVWYQLDGAADPMEVARARQLLDELTAMMDIVATRLRSR